MLLFIFRRSIVKRLRSPIQIHLMLLFIDLCSLVCADSLIFKYISCYCLSPRCTILRNTVSLFKYISCYCLSVMSGYPHRTNIIQIHLMLLFISHFCGFFRVIILHSSALYSLFTLFYQPLPYYCTSLSISSYFLLFSLLVKTLQLIFTW